MSEKPLRVGIVGLGANTRDRHVPGLRACEGVELVAVCNRRGESTQAAAREFNIPRTFDHWRDLVDSPEIDAVVIGAWPYLHAPVTIAALEQGKHVLCEARMAMNAAEARAMLAASQARPECVAQLVPSPLGLRSHQVVVELLRDGFLGQLREVVVHAAGAQWADPGTPLHWRQVAELSGVNMLTLGIVQETLQRWVASPLHVLAQATAFTPSRLDPATGLRRPVGTPDSVQALATLADGARVIYQASGVTHFGPGSQIQLYGSEGTLRIELAPRESVWGARVGEPGLREIPIPEDKAGGWRVEAEFVGAIRGRETIRFTDFTSGVAYMEFTEGVARAAASGSVISLPLDDA